jgi:hypothetical protein
MKHPTLLLLFIGGLLMVCTGCLSTNSHENLTMTIQTLPTTATLTMPHGVSPAVCPTSGNTSPWIQVDPIALNHTVGEPLVITGTTNIKNGEKLRVYVWPPIRGIRTRGEQYCGSWEGETDLIQPGNCSVNTWSFSNINLTRTLPPSCPSYTVIVTDTNNTISGGEDYIRIISNTDQ